MSPQCCLQSTSTGVSSQESRTELNAYVKKIGILYWQKLIRVGVPRGEARRIAAAIAKYDAVNRIPDSYQKQLIVKYSPLICRAHLWRTDILLLAS